MGFSHAAQSPRPMAAPASQEGLFWRRPVERMIASGEARGYRRALSTLDLAGIGIAGMIGAGIFVVLGIVARDVAGPAVVISIALAGIAATFAALTFAEFAAMVPSSGGMYEYTFAAMGRLPAFAVGWSVLMGYTVGNFAVASGWSAFAAPLLGFTRFALPDQWTMVPLEGGIVNLPAMAGMAAVTFACLPRVRTSTWLNNALVAIKISAVAAVVLIGVGFVSVGNWTPFAPFGIQGIITGAAFMLFAFFGFDTIAAAGAEARDPQRSLPRGIIGSIAVATVLYVAMGATITGMGALDAPAPGASAPFGDVPLLSSIGHHEALFLWYVVLGGALVALTTVMYAYVLATARIMQTMAADGFLPLFLARIHPTTGTPWPATLLTGTMMMLGAGFLRLDLAVAATVAATGTAYVMVALGVIVLRRTDPERPRPVRVPLWVAATAVVVLVVIIGSGLSVRIIAAYLAWLGLGLVWYGVGAHRRSVRVMTDDQQAV